MSRVEEIRAMLSRFNAQWRESGEAYEDDTVIGANADVEFLLSELTAREERIGVLEAELGQVVECTESGGDLCSDCRSAARRVLAASITVSPDPRDARIAELTKALERIAEFPRRYTESLSTGMIWYHESECEIARTALAGSEKK